MQYQQSSNPPPTYQHASSFGLTQPPYQYPPPPPYQYPPPPPQPSQSHAKSWLLYATNEKCSKLKITDPKNIEKSKFPRLICDGNNIYKFDYSNGNTTYYYCINKNMKSIKCNARRIYFNGNLKLPSKEENIQHASEMCDVIHIKIKYMN